MVLGQRTKVKDFEGNKIHTVPLLIICNSTYWRQGKVVETCKELLNMGFHSLAKRDVGFCERDKKEDGRNGSWRKRRVCESEACETGRKFVH